MRKVLVTATREFKSTFLTPAFLVATFLIPVVFYVILGFALGSGILEGDQEGAEGTVAVIDRTPGESVVDNLEAYFVPEYQEKRREERILRNIARAKAANPLGDAIPTSDEQLRQIAETAVAPVAQVSVERLPADTDPDSFRDRILSGDILALYVFPEDIVEDESAVVRFELFATQRLKDQIADQLVDGAQEAVVGERYAVAQIDREQVRQISLRPRSDRITITESGVAESGDNAEIIFPLASIMILMIAIFTGSGYLLMSTVEEKSSRVMELLLSGISPVELMTGKILGQAFVGFSVLAVYGGFGLLAAQQFDMLELITPLTLVLLSAYFLIGYFMYAAIFAAIGSSVNEMREAQAMQGPVFGVAFLFIYLGIFAAMQDANSLVTKIISFVPPATPFVMSMRVGNPADPPPMWEVGATLVVGIVSTVVLVWASAKIFRIGVLMYGKPPTLKGLVKMLGQA